MVYVYLSPLFLLIFSFDWAHLNSIKKHHMINQVYKSNLKQNYGEKKKHNN